MNGLAENSPRKTGEVVPFPRSCLPRDAHYVGSPCSVLIEPEAGAWAVIFMSGDGAQHLGISDKAVALATAMDLVQRWNAELTLRNREGI